MRTVSIIFVGFAIGIAAVDICKRLDRIADIMGRGVSPTTSYVYVCKRWPAQGTANWQQWLKDNGECTVAWRQ